MTRSLPHDLRIIPATDANSVRLLLRGGRAAAGFPSPALEFEEPQLDLIRRLIRRSASTYFVICEGTSLLDEFVQPNDIAIVDRSLAPQHNDIVLAIVDDGWVVKKFFCQRGRMALLSSNRNHPRPPIEITDENPIEVWGVVMSVIHEFTAR